MTNNALELSNLELSNLVLSHMRNITRENAECNEGSYTT